MEYVLWGFDWANDLINFVIVDEIGFVACEVFQKLKINLFTFDCGCFEVAKRRRKRVGQRSEKNCLWKLKTKFLQRDNDDDNDDKDTEKHIDKRVQQKKNWKTMMKKGESKKFEDESTWENGWRNTSGLSFYPYACLSLLMSVRSSVCPSVRLSVCPSVRLSVCPSVRLSVCPSVHLSVFPFALLSVCPSVCLSVCPGFWVSEKVVFVLFSWL